MSVPVPALDELERAVDGDGVVVLVVVASDFS